MNQTDDEIVDEIKERFKFAMDYEAYTRLLNVDDYKFGIGDSDNGYQWPDSTARNRQAGNQPMLTINETRVRCLHIINDAKQNKVACKISPTGDEATKEAADIFEGVIRHIEYQSQAEDVYDNAVKSQVYMGIGYWRICTDYVDDKSFDQEIYIRPVKDPLTVYLDPDINEVDGSDARWGLFFKDIPRKQFDDEYPKLKDQIGRDPLGELTVGQLPEHKIRLVEYYRRTPKKDKLIATPDGKMMFASQLVPELIAALKEDPETKIRPVTRHEVEWFKVAGGKIVGRGKWPSQYIPIVRVPGEESFVDGIYDRCGHVRALKSAQRMKNYWFSSAVEFVALQSKSPYIGPMDAFDGLETYWNQANTSNLAWLPYKAYDESGRLVEKPQRQEPPTMAQAHLQGMQMASIEMQNVSGQNESDMGKESNEKSGIAIQQRQRRGENATYGFVDALAFAVRYTGRILIDMIPKVYDTARVIQIIGDDGEQTAVHIDPQAKQPLSQVPQQAGQPPKQIFNPAMGRYAVEADVGPSWGTRRQETFNALVQIISTQPELSHIIGDLLFKSADFQGADEMAERLKNMIPPQALGGPGPELQAAQAEITKLNGVIAKIMQQLVEAKQENDNGTVKHGIEEFRAMTDRMQAIKDIDPEVLVPIVRQMAHDATGLPLPALQSMHGLTPGSPQARGEAPPPPPTQPQGMT
ncbi:MAG TPA: portal protein [Halothiobacillus sp.]|nr:portal protein [Halothiobacillus sp.]